MSGRFGQICEKLRNHQDVSPVIGQILDEYERTSSLIGRLNLPLPLDSPSPIYYFKDQDGSAFIVKLTQCRYGYAILRNGGLVPKKKGWLTNGLACELLITALVWEMASAHLVRPVDFFVQQDGLYFQMVFEGMVADQMAPCLLDPISRTHEGSLLGNNLLHLDAVCDAIACPLTSQLLEEICFMVLFTLACLQETHGFMHLDLKASNVLISLEPSTHYRWLHYQVAGRDFYLPFRGFQTRLCDFGCSSVMNLYGRGKQILLKDYSQGLGKLINFDGTWQPGYDMHFFFPQLWALCDQWGIEVPSLILTAISKWSLAVDPTNHRPKNPLCPLSALEMLDRLAWPRRFLAQPKDQEEETVRAMGQVVRHQPSNLQTKMEDLPAPNCCEGPIPHE